MPSANRSNPSAPDWLLDLPRRSPPARDSSDEECEVKSKRKAKLRRRSILRKPHRDARRVNPDDHWLSEDEGAVHVEFYMERNARLVQSGEVGGSSGNTDGGPPAPPSPCTPAMNASSDSLHHHHQQQQQDAMSKKADLTEDTPMQPTLDILVPSFYDKDLSHAVGSLLPDQDRLLSVANATLVCPQCTHRLSSPVTLACGHTLCAKCCWPATPLGTNHASHQCTQASSLPRRSPLRSLANALYHPRRGSAASSASSSSSDSSASSDKSDLTSAITCVISPRCPLPLCRQLQATPSLTSNTTSEPSDPYEGYIVKPCVVLVNILEIVDRIETHQLASALSKHIAPSPQETEEEKSTPARDVLSEIECQVCCSIMDEPITTRCSHTFCRNCLARSLDHSEYCPLCRCQLPSFQHFVRQKPSAVLVNFMNQAFPAQTEQRRLQQAEENKTPTPIFVCTLAFPSIPTHLHIFEPRYRLMMRRAWDGDRRFGMCMPGENGGIHPYGTMLELRKFDLLPDGRSLIETVGVGRFKLGATDVMDGYTVAQIEPIVDLSAEEEAESEARALERNVAARAQMRERLTNPNVVNVATITTAPAPELTTAQLVQRCHDFLKIMRTSAAPWLRQRLNDSLGPVPENAADLSFYMAALLPIYESEKVRLLEVSLFCFVNLRKPCRTDKPNF